MIYLLHVQIYEISSIVYKWHVYDTWIVQKCDINKCIEYDMDLSNMNSFIVYSEYYLACLDAKI